MGRNKEYTSDAVKESVQAAMAKIKAYFDKKWAPGKEYDVIKHIQSLLDAEIDKYVAPGKAGDTIVDIYFKSGEEVCVYAFTDEGDSIPDGLADCFLAAKKNPEILTRPFPVNLIGCDTVEGIEYFFDGNAVEYYITGRDSEEDMVELHFASGNVIEALSALDENLYPGESVETLVDDCICRYFSEK